MARPKTVFTPPSWFKLSDYESAGAMDAADWYLNLKLRFRLSKRAIDEGAAQHLLRRFIRGGQPLVRRADEVGFEFFGLDIGGDFAAIIHGREPRPSVCPLRVEEFYFFEKRLPADLRAFGAAFVPGAAVDPRNVPKGFVRDLSLQ